MLVELAVWLVLVGAAQGEPAPAEAPAPDPASCAHAHVLLGAGCPWTTEVMAKRVLTEGRSWTFAGRMVPVEEELESRVAAPYAVGPEEDVRVVANEVLQAVVDAGADQGRVQLEGRRLEVGGVTYFALTAFRALR